MNEPNEYNEIQSAVLAEGRRYLAVMRRWTVAPIILSTSKSVNNDAGVTGVS